MEQFIQGLTHFEGQIAYLEGTHWGVEKALLQAIAIENPQVAIEAGTLWPKPLNFHIEINNRNLETIIYYGEQSGHFHICSHFHVYSSGEFTLEWYDVLDLNLWMNPKLPEDVVAYFSQFIGSSYRWIEHE